MKGTPLVIPATLRNSVLSRLHEGHLRVAGDVLNEVVLICKTCINEPANHKEPNLSTDSPELGAELAGY